MSATSVRQSDTLLGNAAKASKKLGWVARTTFAELVGEMVRSDLLAAEQEQFLRRAKNAGPGTA